MTETPDRRIRKTQTALLSAFLTLLLEVGYDKLTIGGVAELANVGRSTFYEHYRIKRDLLKASVSQPLAHFADLANVDATDALLSDILIHFREQNHVARTLLHGPTRPILSAVLAGLLLERLKQRGLKRALISPEIAARQIAEAQIALLEVWVFGRPHSELSQIAKALKLTTDALIASIENQA
jgi:AcrR family transcriptional regulator